MLIPLLGGRELGQKRPQFVLRLFVVLFVREAEGFLEQRLRRGALAQLEMEFAEEDARHHPVGFLCDAGRIVRDRLGAAVFRDQGLGQAEAEELVVGLPGCEGLELLHARGQGKIRKREAGAWRRA